MDRLDMLLQRMPHPDNIRPEMLKLLGDPKHFYPIMVGTKCFSIQASSMHYCRPRATYPDSKQYTHFEVMLPEDEQPVTLSRNEVMLAIELAEQQTGETAHADLAFWH